MSKPTLKYFPIRGRGEEVRMALALGGVEHVDEDVAFDAWPKLKPDTPLGVLPTYTDGDLVLVQSMAILRHIGRKAGLYGADDTERAVIDVVLDQTGDVLNDTVITGYVLSGVAAGDDQAKKDASRDKAVGQLAALEKWLAKAGNIGDGYVVKSGVSIADVRLFHVVHNLVRPLKWGDALNAAAPATAAWYKRMRACDKVKAFLGSAAHKAVMFPPFAPVLKTPEACADGDA